MFLFWKKVYFKVVIPPGHEVRLYAPMTSLRDEAIAVPFVNPSFYTCDAILQKQLYNCPPRCLIISK